jgi:hypothetical protein
MGYKLNELSDVLINQISEIVLGGTGEVPAEPNTFLTWCQPGIPFAPSQFDFAVHGLGSKKEPKENLELLTQAFQFAQLVDFIPDIRAAYTGDKQAARFNPDAEERLTTIYELILKVAKVVHHDLTPEEQAKVEKIRGILGKMKKTENELGETTEVLEDSPMYKTYKAKSAAYRAAELQYKAKNILAMSASGEAGNAAVADWALNAGLYLEDVKAAEDDWSANGWRGQIDDAMAVVQALTERSMEVWRSSLLTFFKAAEVNATGPGTRFRYTTMIPADLEQGGWTNYSVSHSLVDTKAHSEATQASASLGLNLGFWSFGGSGQGSTSEQTSSIEVDNFNLSFQLCMTVISRPWFYPEFFSNRGWTLKTGEGWEYTDPPSDGAPPPDTKGKFIGYPTIILWARNVNIESTQFASAYETYASQFGGGGSVGWGPFTLSGAGAHQESDAHMHTETTGQGLKVEGMQIIGFVNHLIGKAPNLLESIKEDELI